MHSTSNTLGLSNSVSQLIESLANAEERKHEVISTEDLIYNVKKHDREVAEMRKERKNNILRKITCKHRDEDIGENKSPE